MTFSKQLSLSQSTHRYFWSAALTVALIMTSVRIAAAEDLPKADKVMSKYLEVVGKYTKTVDGKVAKLKNRVTKTNLILSNMGVEATITTYLKPPNSYTEIQFDFGIVESGTRDDIAWEINLTEGPRILEGDEKATRLRQATFNQFLNWQEIYSKAETVGEESVGEAACYKVVLTPSRGNPLTCYFDKKSGLILKTEVDQEDSTIETTMSDYKEVDGIKIPHKIMIDGGEYGLEITIESVNHNADIPKERFDLPDEIKTLIGQTK